MHDSQVYLDSYLIIDISFQRTINKLYKRFSEYFSKLAP